MGIDQQVGRHGIGLAHGSGLRSGHDALVTREDVVRNHLGGRLGVIVIQPHVKTVRVVDPVIDARDPLIGVLKGRYGVVNQAVRPRQGRELKQILRRRRKFRGGNLIIRIWLPGGWVEENDRLGSLQQVREISLAMVGRHADRRSAAVQSSHPGSLIAAEKEQLVL